MPVKVYGEDLEESRKLGLTKARIFRLGLGVAKGMEKEYKEQFRLEQEQHAQENEYHAKELTTRNELTEKNRLEFLAIKKPIVEMDNGMIKYWTKATNTTITELTKIQNELFKKQEEETAWRLKQRMAKPTTPPIK